MSELHTLYSVCKAWWATCIVAETGSARRARAELRRSASVTDVLGLSVTHELHRRLVDAGYDLRKRRDGPDRLAVMAVALAHLTQDRDAPVAQRFGTGDRKALSELRFNTLIRAKAPRQLMRPLARALGIVEGSANVGRLASDLYWWSDTIRNRWCFEYHGAADARPTTTEETPA